MSAEFGSVRPGSGGRRRGTSAPKAPPKKKPAEMSRAGRTLEPASPITPEEAFSVLDAAMEKAYEDGWVGGRRLDLAKRVCGPLYAATGVDDRWAAVFILDMPSSAAIGLYGGWNDEIADRYTANPFYSVGRRLAEKWSIDE